MLVCQIPDQIFPAKDGLLLEEEKKFSRSVNEVSHI